ncbi:Zinc finger protein 37 homolog [Eumeta japonica]|uniref:Zinc finger protein 37 homolog n=1 Tax=Eumeta variegata TaxID=151549 RepID=A0A4C1XS01_EUMVA|nr:Zinc finger protein 37 homolog [Eumeta japonica]
MGIYMGRADWRFGTATSDENRELERQYVTPGAAETAAGCYRLAVEEKCEDLTETNDNLDENSKSDEADTPLLIDQVSIINDGIIVEESSNVDDPLRLNDARDRNEDVISEDSSIMERTSRNNEELKSSKKRVRKLLANRKQSAKSRKGTNQEARPPKRMRRATKKNSLTFEVVKELSEARGLGGGGTHPAVVSTKLGAHRFLDKRLSSRLHHLLLRCYNTITIIMAEKEIHHGLPSDQETTEENANKSLQASQELDNRTANLEDTSGQNHVEATQQPISSLCRLILCMDYVIRIRISKLQRSRREQDPRRAAAPISTRDMIVSRSTADGKRLLACGLCNTEFRFMSRITKHLRSHTGEKPFRCEECDARFKLPHHLTQHRRTHTGERPYRCDLCDMTFRQTAHLIIHKRTHTGEKPYRCGICGARFRQSGSLTYHEQKHAGERREYCCDMCDGKFKDADGLSQHKRTHKREGLEYGVYRVKFKQSRPLVGHRRAMKVFQVVGF